MTASLREAVSKGIVPGDVVQIVSERRLESAATSLQRRVAARGAVLMALGMVTGLWSGIALSGKVVVALPRLALAAHLNALMGCFWLVALAFTLPMLSYGQKGKERLVKLTLLPTYGNWLVTLIASFVGVRGISFTGERANDVVAVLLLAVVVAPALVATFAWAWGFRRPGRQ